MGESAGGVEAKGLAVVGFGGGPVPVIALENVGQGNMRFGERGIELQSSPCI